MRHPLSTFQIDALLCRIAIRQLGLVSVGQAATAGVDKHALARRRAAGVLVPVFDGVLRLGSVAATMHQRILAGALAVPGSSIAGPSAAVLHCLPMPTSFTDDNATVFVSIEPARVVRLTGIKAVRQDPPRAQRWLSVRVATPAATLLLLPRYVDHDTVERCLDHCITHRLITAVGMRTLIGRTPTRAAPGRRFLLGLLDERSGGMGHRSGTEQRVATWLRQAGLAGWRRNHPVRVARRGSLAAKPVEVDFAWTEAKVALEVSPFYTHGSRETQERDAERRRLLVAAGWRVVEAVDADIEGFAAFRPTITLLRSLIS